MLPQSYSVSVSYSRKRETSVARLMPPRNDTDVLLIPALCAIGRARPEPRPVLPNKPVPIPTSVHQPTMTMVAVAAGRSPRMIADAIFGDDARPSVSLITVTEYFQINGSSPRYKEREREREIDAERGTCRNKRGCPARQLACKNSRPLTSRLVLGSSLYKP